MSAQPQDPGPVVACPGCGHRFPLTQVLVGPIEAKVARRLEAEYETRARQREQEEGRRIADAVAQATKKALAGQAVEVKSLREQVAEQQQALAATQEAELALRKRTRELEAREKALALDVERQVAERTKAVEEETAKRIGDQHRLKDLEKDKQLADTRQQLEDATRKLRQGSQQTQGEVAERDLEDQLRQAFPLDRFEAIATGVRGADILQRVVDQRGQVCGTIIWERKNAKNFADTWIPKLRDDQRAAHAELAVLVSATLPKEVTTVFGKVGGVWVATPAAALPLAAAFRHELLEISRARIVAEGQAGKETAVLAYVSGTVFRQRIEAVLDAIIGMVDDLEKERRAIETHWARRRQQHALITAAIAGMWGDVSGITGTLLTPKQLQLPAGGGSDKEAA